MSSVGTWACGGHPGRCVPGCEDRCPQLTGGGTGQVNSLVSVHASSWSRAPPPPGRTPGAPEAAAFPSSNLQKAYQLPHSLLSIDCHLEAATISQDNTFVCHSNHSGLCGSDTETGRRAASLSHGLGFGCKTWRSRGGLMRRGRRLPEPRSLCLDGWRRLHLLAPRGLLRLLSCLLISKGRGRRGESRKLPPPCGLAQNSCSISRAPYPLGQNNLTPSPD